MTGAAALELSAAPLDLEERFSDFVASHRDRARRLAWRLIDGVSTSGSALDLNPVNAHVP